MKLKIKLGHTTVVVEVESSITLNALKCVVLSQMKLINQEVILSLNKQTPLEGDDETLADLGLVAGDIVHVLSNELATDEKLSVELCLTSQSDMSLSTSDCPLSGANSEIAMDDQCTDISTSVNHELTHSDATNNKYLNEPVLVRESTQVKLPETVICAYSLSPPNDGNMAVVIIVNILMSELGYRLTKASNNGNQLQGGRILLDYVYPHLTGHSFQLLCIPVHGLLFIHAFVRQSEDTVDKKQIQLKTSDYIKDLTSDASTTYNGSSLPALSRLFKDCVAYPLLHSALQDSDDLQIPSLSYLVFELQLHICSFLDFKSLLNLSQVSHYLHDVAIQPVLWRQLYVKDFGSLCDMKLTQNWLTLYKDKYVMKKNMNMRSSLDWNRRPQFVDSPYPILPHPFPYGPSGFMIGGEYDLRPCLTPDPFSLSQMLRPRPPLLPSVQPASVTRVSRDAALPGVPGYGCLPFTNRFL